MSENNSLGHNESEFGSQREEKSDLKTSSEMIEDLVDEKDKKKIPIKLIKVFNGTIRCHRCGTSRGAEDKGKFVQINNFVAWFHNEECFRMWETIYGGRYKTGALLDAFGREM